MNGVLRDASCETISSALTGFGIRCDALLKAIHADTARVPTFVGIKFSSPVRGVSKHRHEHGLRLLVLVLL